ncbi:MAG: helix-turn-helix transcriptional regulator [Lachnospiraceae bacterium]|nr:helix-turn-helix transcriptional regulator [Lachnospiraceae bacterium]
MSANKIDKIFEQIDKLNKPNSEQEALPAAKTNGISRSVLNEISSEIQRILDENGFTQEDLCRITGMSQSNISKILNGKVAPRIDTLQKIAESTHTKLVISFESND